MSQSKLKWWMWHSLTVNQHPAMKFYRQATARIHWLNQTLMLPQPATIPCRSCDRRHRTIWIRHEGFVWQQHCCCNRINTLFPLQNVRRWSQSLSKGAKGRKSIRQRTIHCMPSRQQKRKCRIEWRSLPRLIGFHCSSTLWQPSAQRYRWWNGNRPARAGDRAVWPSDGGQRLRRTAENVRLTALVDLITLTHVIRFLFQRNSSVAAPIHFD